MPKDTLGQAGVSRSGANHGLGRDSRGEISRLVDEALGPPGGMMREDDEWAGAATSCSLHETGDAASAGSELYDARNGRLSRRDRLRWCCERRSLA